MKLMADNCDRWNREKSLRDDMIRIGNLMYERGLVVGNDGNLSARLDENHVLCTPSGLCKGLMTADQLIVIDMEGRKVETSFGADPELRPTSEVPMHLEVYRQRPDVDAVVHAHPPITVALSIAGISLADCMLPEVIVNLGLVPTAEYATPASVENVTAVSDLIANHDGIILQRHGALTVGRCLMDAFMRLESLEQIAKITLILRQLNMGGPLPPDQVEKLMAQRDRMGLSRPGDREEFSQICGVCPTTPSPLQPGYDQAADVGASSEEDLVRLVTQAVLRELGANGS
jgi:L-fuculose-phosphate aldolase